MWTDLSHTVPHELCARYGHQAIVSGKTMLVMGGHDCTRYLDDIWECDLQGLFWCQVGVSNALSPAPPLPHEVLSIEMAEPAEGGASSEERARADGGFTRNVAAVSRARRAAGKSAAPARPSAAAAAESSYIRRPKAGRLGRVHSSAATTLQAHARARRDRVRAAYMRHEANEQYDAAAFLQNSWRARRVSA